MGENIEINEEGEFGAGMTLFDKLQLLTEWAPVIGRLQAVMDAKTPQDRAKAIVKAWRWAMLLIVLFTAVTPVVIEFFYVILKVLHLFP
jgi:hypothetical protein